MIGRPDTTEFASYQREYVSKVPGSDIMTFLQQQLDTTVDLLRGVGNELSNYRYEPGKWSVKELMGHIIDTERVFAYRALVFARNDSTSLPGFDQEPWAKHAGHANVPMPDLIDEFQSVRHATIHFFRHLDQAAWNRQGTANNNPVSVRALAYLIAGHTQHHLDILKSKYLAQRSIS